MLPIDWHRQRIKTGMSPAAEALLCLISVYKAMSVMELVALAIKEEIASSATIHRSFMWLRKSKFIDIEFHDGNQRTKYVIATKKGDKYIGFSK
jgi:hypothetical protein